MTKKELEKLVLACLDDLCSQNMTDSEALLIAGFVDNLRQGAGNKDQSDDFAGELAARLKTVKTKQK